MIEVGGPRLVQMENVHGKNALHDTCLKEDTPINIISKLIETGGSELVNVMDIYGRTALCYACINRFVNFQAIKDFKYLYYATLQYPIPQGMFMVSFNVQ